MCLACPQYYVKNDSTKSMKQSISKSVLKKQKEKNNMPRSRIKPYSDTLLTWKSLTVEKKTDRILINKKNDFCTLISKEI